MSTRDRLTGTLDWAGSRLDDVMGSARQRVPIQRRRGLLHLPGEPASTAR